MTAGFVDAVNSLAWQTDWTCCVGVSLWSQTVATVWLMVALLHCNWSYAVDWRSRWPFMMLEEHSFIKIYIILWSYFWTTGSLLSCKIKKKQIWFAAWNFGSADDEAESSEVWFLFVFTLTCWYEGCGCSAGGVWHSGILFSCQWLWNSTYLSLWGGVLCNHRQPWCHL